MKKILLLLCLIFNCADAVKHKQPASKKTSKKLPKNKNFKEYQRHLAQLRLLLKAEMAYDEMERSFFVSPEQMIINLRTAESISN